MKTLLRIILLAIIMAIVGYVLFVVLQREEPAARPFPGMNGTSVTTTTPAPGTSAATQVPVTIQAIKENASSSPTVSVEFPQFPTLPAGFNAAIQSAVLGRLSAFKSDAADNYRARQATAPADEHISPSDFSFIARWEPVQINGRYVSFIERFDSYTGGANENQELQTFDYDVAGAREMSISDLLTGTTTLAEISQIAHDQLVAHIGDVGGPDAPTDLVDAGTAPTPDNYADFTFNDYMLTIYFPKYAVAPGSFGEQRVDVPMAQIR